MKHKQFILKDIVQLADNQIKCIIATDDVDRDGEILNIDGLDTTSFQKNPVVLWAHDYWAPAIGKCISLTKMPGQLEGVIEFATGMGHDMAELACKLYKSGIQSAVSIGFIPTDGLWNQVKEAFEFTKAEMLEFSCVPVPANANALVTAKSLGIDMSALIQKDAQDMYVCGDKGLSLADDESWDGSAAAKRVATWAGGPEKENIDWKKYGKAFVVCDRDNADTFGGYKLPFADVIDGKLQAVPRGIEAVAGVLQGARGGVEAPASVIADAKEFIASYYKKMDKTLPWEDKSVHLKSGQTLSEKNMQAVQSAHTHLTKVLKDAGCDMGGTPEWPVDSGPQGDPTNEPSNDESANPEMEKRKQVSPATNLNTQKGKRVLRLKHLTKRVRFVLATNHPK